METIQSPQPGLLQRIETEEAIHLIKDHFAKELKEGLGLSRNKMWREGKSKGSRKTLCCATFQMLIRK